jgi:outer membrane protein assembly factor BamB
MRRIAWLVAALLLGGCGMTEKMSELLADDDNVEPPTPLVEFTPTAKIRRTWSLGVGAGTDELFVKLAPVAADTTIYTAERDGEVRAIDSKTGKEFWDTETDARLSGGPGVGDGLVLVGSSDGEIIALEAADGSERWRKPVSSEVLAAPRAAEGLVLVRTGDGKLAALSADHGARIWIYDRTVPVLTLRGTSPPLITGDLVIAGFDSGRLTALELKTGKLVWEAQIAVPRGRSDLERMVDIDAELLVRKDTLYVATFQGKVAAISLDSGDTIWSREISSAAGIAIDGKRVYVTDEDSVVWALDRRSGSSLWKHEDLKARALTAPAALGDHVVVGDLEGYLHWLNKRDGQLAARERLDRSKILVAPIAVDGVLVGYSADGELAGYVIE